MKRKLLFTPPSLAERHYIIKDGIIQSPYTQVCKSFHCNYSWSTEGYSYNVTTGDGYIQYCGRKYNDSHGLWFPGITNEGWTKIGADYESDHPTVAISIRSANGCECICIYKDPTLPSMASETINILVGRGNINNPDKGITVKVYNLWLE